MPVSRNSHLLDIARQIVQFETEFSRSRDLEIAKQIARLENEYARIANDDRRFVADAVVEHGDEHDIPPDRRAQTYAQRILAALARSSLPITAQAIAAAIEPPNALPTIRAILSKLVDGGSVERVSTGVYRAAEVGHRRGVADDD